MMLYPVASLRVRWWRIPIHWWYMLVATSYLLLTFGRARFYFAYKALRDLQLPPSVLLTSKEKRRLQHYFYGTTFLGVLFCALRGRIRTAQERHRFTNLSALAYLFDDLVDSFRGRDDSGILWQDNPEEYGRAADDDRRLALHFLHNIYEELPAAHLTVFKATMHEVFNVETAGRQITRTALPLHDLGAITHRKGGYSVLMFRHALDDLPNAADSAACLQFGCLIQLCDDIFDLWFDEQDGTATVVTHFARQGDIRGLSDYFEAQVAATKAAFRATAHPARRVETAIRVAHFIVSITRVCVRHYQQLSDSGLILTDLDRATLVVDMEKWPNRIRTAWVLAMEE